MSAIDRRYQDKDYRNWLSCVNGLRALRCLLRTFLEDQTQLFHQELVDKLGTFICITKCEIVGNIKPKELPDVCEVCTPWSYELLDNHSAKGSPIHWGNCNPQRWPGEKWEAAKVYMPGGHKTHVKFDDFDIAALINLMSRCTHFQRVIKAKKLQQILNNVTEVRNKVMHSPAFTISSQDLKEYLRKIKDLGRVLKPHAPDMESLSQEIDKGTGEQSLEEFKKMELVVMKEEINSISVSFSEVPRVHSEKRSQNMMVVVGRLWSFMVVHPDLQAALSMQVAHLYWMMEHKKQLMQTIAKIAEMQEQQEKIQRDQQLLDRERMKTIQYFEKESKKTKELVEKERNKAIDIGNSAKDEIKKVKEELSQAHRAFSINVCRYGFILFAICALISLFFSFTFDEYVYALFIFMGSFATSLVTKGGIQILKSILVDNP